MQRSPWAMAPAAASLLVCWFLAALVDRQEAIFDRHRQDAHRGAVVGAIALRIVPGTRRGLVVQERLVQVRTEELPVVAAELEGGLGAVVQRVEEERAAAPARRVAEQVIAGPQNLRRVVLSLPADFQGEDAGARAGNGHSALGLVAEAAAEAVLRALDV